MMMFVIGIVWQSGETTTKAVPLSQWDWWEWRIWHQWVMM